MRISDWSSDVCSSDLGAAPTATAHMQIQLNDLERQLTNLTGRIEDLGFRLDTVTDRLDRLVADVDLRLRNLEQGGLPPVGAAAPTGEPGLEIGRAHV